MVSRCRISGQGGDVDALAKATAEAESHTGAKNWQGARNGSISGDLPNNLLLNGGIKTSEAGSWLSEAIGCLDIGLVPNVEVREITSDDWQAIDLDSKISGRSASGCGGRSATDVIFPIPGDINDTGSIVIVRLQSGYRSIDSTGYASAAVRLPAYAGDGSRKCIGIGSRFQQGPAKDRGVSRCAPLTQSHSNTIWLAYNGSLNGCILKGLDIALLLEGKFIYVNAPGDIQGEEELQVNDCRRRRRHRGG